MRIVILTGIFPPEIGGPATYVEQLALKLHEKGINVEVLCYSDRELKKKYKFRIKRISKRYPVFIRNFIHLPVFLMGIVRNDFIYILSTSPGIAFLPLVLAKFLRKKVLVRPGSDFLWDRAIQRGEKDFTIPEFYRAGVFKKNKFSYFIFKYLIRSVDFIVFPTSFLKNLYIKYYQLDESKSEIVDYPFPDVSVFNKRDISGIKEIITACRLVRFKNLSRLIDAFSMINREGVVLKIIGDGPQENDLKKRVAQNKLEKRVIFEKTLPHDELMERIKNSYLVVIPSIFEPGSFLALECIKLGIPILFTKEAGLYERFKNTLIFIDPLNASDIKEKIEYLLDKKNWLEYRQKMSQIDTIRNWSDVADDHIEIFKRL